MYRSITHSPLTTWTWAIAMGVLVSLNKTVFTNHWSRSRHAMVLRLTSRLLPSICRRIYDLNAWQVLQVFQRSTWNFRKHRWLRLFLRTMSLIAANLLSKFPSMSWLKKIIVAAIILPNSIIKKIRWKIPRGLNLTSLSMMRVTTKGPPSKQLSQQVGSVSTTVRVFFRRVRKLLHVASRELWAVILALTLWSRLAVEAPACLRKI